MDSLTTTLGSRMLRLWVGAVAIGFWPRLAMAQTKPNPFDPTKYIENKELQDAQVATKLSGKSIFRINGSRFFKFMTSDAAVFLPAIGSKPELLEGSALCEGHLKLMREVIPLRENLPVEPEILKDQPKILALIQKCRDGAIPGPTLVIDRPDGAQVEVKSKDSKTPERNSGGS